MCVVGICLWLRRGFRGAFGVPSFFVCDFGILVYDTTL